MTEAIIDKLQYWVRQGADGVWIDAADIAALGRLADEVVRLREALAQLDPLLRRIRDNNEIISETARSALAGAQGDG